MIEEEQEDVKEDEGSSIELVKVQSRSERSGKRKWYLNVKTARNRQLQSQTARENDKNAVSAGAQVVSRHTRRIRRLADDRHHATGVSCRRPWN